MFSLTRTLALKASDTLTASQNFIAGETLELATRLYTFVEVLTAAFQVLIGTALTDSLDNLKAAVNGDAGEGTLYGEDTPPLPFIEASAKTGTTLKLEATLAGAQANGLPAAANATHASFANPTLAGGADETDRLTRTAAGNGDWVDISDREGDELLAVHVNALTAEKTARLIIEDAADAQGSSPLAVLVIPLTGPIDPSAPRDITLPLTALAGVRNFVRIRLASISAQASITYGAWVN